HSSKIQRHGHLGLAGGQAGPVYLQAPDGGVVARTVPNGSNTRPSSPPSSSATVLVTTESYNAAGWLQDVVDARGIDARTSYDNLGRKTQTIGRGKGDALRNS